jgi:hypothetical protein
MQWSYIYRSVSRDQFWKQKFVSWDRCFDFKNIFAEKFSKILAFFARTTASFWENLIITLVFEKNANFFAGNWQKSQKIVIDPWSGTPIKKLPSGSWREHRDRLGSHQQQPGRPGRQIKFRSFLQGSSAARRSRDRCYKIPNRLLKNAMFVRSYLWLSYFLGSATPCASPPPRPSIFS